MSGRSPVRRVAAVLYAAGTLALLAGVTLLFAADALDDDTVETVGTVVLTGAWLMLVVAAVIDVIHRRREPA